MFWKRKTDEEFVESERKWLNGSKWLAGFCLLAAILQGVFIAICYNMLLKMSTETAREGFPIGLLAGFFSGIACISVGVNCRVALYFFLKPRASRLLIEYHDRLHEKQKQPVFS